MFSRRLARTLTTSARSLKAEASTSAAAAPELVAGSEARLTLPYTVSRSSSGQLPVYSDYRNGGNNVRTVVRKIRGNHIALRNDLAQYLADGHIDPLRAPPAVIMRPTSRNIEVRGRWVDEVKDWLEARGF